MKVQINKNTTPIVSPAVVVSVGTGDESNLITLAWVARVVSKPPVMSISIRPTRYSFPILEDLKEYVINVPFSEHVRDVDFCGTRTGKKVNKWEELGLTKEKASKVQVPLIKEFPINIECKVVQTMNYGSHKLFFGEVQAVNVAEELTDDGKLISNKLDEIVYIPRNYHSLKKEPLEKQGFSVKL
ncbi:MAG: flavin reductase family protein [Promethearchaeota archaeon]|nr:MAG: flavin reductase family protein [Candidatus Lokiarchaeota archaeon]